MDSACVFDKKHKMCLCRGTATATTVTMKSDVQVVCKPFDTSAKKYALSCRMGSQLQRAEEAAKRALVMQHEYDQAGNLMPKSQVKRLMHADRVIHLEMEVSRLEASYREQRAKLDRSALQCSFSQQIIS